MKKLWAVLTKADSEGNKSLSGDGEICTCEGIFTTPELASEHCPERCGIMLFDLDKPWPRGTLDAEEFYFPHLETREEGKARLHDLAAAQKKNAAK